MRSEEVHSFRARTALLAKEAHAFRARVALRAKKPTSSALGSLFGRKKPTPSALCASFRGTAHSCSRDPYGATDGEARSLLDDRPCHRWQGTLAPATGPLSPLARHTFSYWNGGATGRRPDGSPAANRCPWPVITTGSPLSFERKASVSQCLSSAEEILVIPAGECTKWSSHDHATPDGRARADAEDDPARAAPHP